MNASQTLYKLSPNEINQTALEYLDHLLDRCTLNLVSKLTGITRPTLYRWLDESLPLDAMNYRDSAWFILFCDTSPKMQVLINSGPLSHPRLAGRLLAEGEDNADD